MRVTVWLGLLAALLPTAGHAAICSVTIQDQDFGTVDVLPGTNIDTASGTVSVTCTRGVLDILQTDVCINVGNGTGGRDGTGRKMTGPATLYYQLYTDVGRSTVWGDRAQAFPTVPRMTFTSSGTTSQSRTMYGRILASQQTVLPGSLTSDFTTSAHANIRYGAGVLGLLGCDAIDLGLLGGSATGTFQVRATVDKICNVSTTPLNFGTRGLLSSAVTAQGALIVTCTNGTTYDIGLGDGENSTGVMARRMKAGASFISYGLYKTNGYTTAWGNSGADRLAGTGTGASQTIDVFGRVPAQPTPAPATYIDNVVVTLTY